MYPNKIIVHPLHQAQTFHEDVDGVPEYPEGGGEHEDGEDEGADGVDQRPLGLEVDDQRGNKHAQALQEVPQHVDEGRLHVDVLLQGCDSIDI